MSSAGGVSIFEVLREQVSLEEVAGRYTRLKRSGRSLKGRCPYPDDDDDDPSFHVYPDGRFCCYGCRRHGDVTDLWAGVRGIEPGTEAALDLAREYGVERPDPDPKARRRARERREREGEYAKWAEACYRALSKHRRVAEWWERRGFDRELRERFLLGTNRDGTEAVIPYWHRGRIQGLIRRKLEGAPKYRYPGAEDFPAGHRPLFIPGSTGNGAFLVEGIVDALAVVAIGESAVAVGGTKISERQRWELERFPGSLYLLPDADEEGAKAAREWTRELYPGARLCPAEYGGNRKDVADLFAAEGGRTAEVLNDLKGRAVDALDLALSEAPEGSARERYGYAREHVLPLLLRLEDAGEREAALEDAAQALSYTIRVMQSDGRLEYEATEKMPDGSMRNVVHQTEGPTMIVQTTTQNHLHPENETRVFPIYIDESEEQTGRIVGSILREASGVSVDPEERERVLQGWRDDIRLLSPGAVVIPYAERIEIPVSPIRIRRDARRLIDVVRVISWMHQHQREEDTEGRILATEDDFNEALELVSDSLRRAWQTLTPAEETVLEVIEKLPEQLRKQGFRRRDLKIPGVSDRRIKEVLKSLTDTGYLDCDGRQGPQGYTYTVARAAEEVSLGISLRPSPGSQ